MALPELTVIVGSEVYPLPPAVKVAVEPYPATAGVIVVADGNQTRWI